IANLSSEQGQQIAGADPEYYIRDLYNAIAGGNYPSWNMYVQIMTPEQAAANPYDPFDDTKVWLHADYPLIPVGKFVLNKNPSSYFAEVEQIAFDVAHLIPGIEPSPDRMLQGRLFNYGDTHRYRLGINNTQLPVNSPFKVTNYSRDGRSTLQSQTGAPNYHPNSFNGPENDKRARALAPILPISGDANRIDSGNDDNYTQARLLYQNVMTADARGRLIQNIISWLKYANTVIQDRSIGNFSKVDEDLGRKIREGLNVDVHPHVNL
ncbi:Catalase, partial [Gonioctena quinquepunctata]